ncbi:hypothetical protein [Lysobacter tyrosinilyticus]
MNHNNDLLPEEDEQFLAEIVESLAVRPWNNVIHSHYMANNAAQLIQSRALRQQTEAVLKQAAAAERFAAAAELQAMHLERLTIAADRMQEDGVEEAGRAALLIVRCLNSAQDVTLDQKDVSIESTNANLEQARKSKSYKASLDYLREDNEELAELFAEAFAGFSDDEEHEIQARRRLALMVVLAKRIVCEVEDESPALERLEAVSAPRRTAST